MIPKALYISIICGKYKIRIVLTNLKSVFMISLKLIYKCKIILKRIRISNAMNF